MIEIENKALNMKKKRYASRYKSRKIHGTDYEFVIFIKCLDFFAERIPAFDVYFCGFVLDYSHYKDYNKCKNVVEMKC